MVPGISMRLDGLLMLGRQGGDGAIPTVVTTSRALSRTRTDQFRNGAKLPRELERTLHGSLGVSRFTSERVKHEPI